MQLRLAAAAFAAFVALPALLAPGAAAAQVCAVTLTMPFGSVVASGTVTPTGARGIGFRTWTPGRAEAKFVVTWPLIGGSVCSKTVDKNDPDLRAAWASARVQGLTVSSLTQTADAAGAKTYGAATKQYSVTLKSGGYYMGSGAVGAYVNSFKSIVLNEFARFYAGTLEGTFGGMPVTFQLSGIENRVPIYGCSLQLSEKTSNVVVRCSGLTFAQLPRTSVSSGGNATLTGSSIVFSKATTQSVPFSSAAIINI